MGKFFLSNEIIRGYLWLNWTPGGDGFLVFKNTDCPVFRFTPNCIFMKKNTPFLLFLAILLSFSPIFGQKKDFTQKKPVAPPVAICKEPIQIAIGAGQSDYFNCPNFPGSNGSLADLPGMAQISAADLDGGSYDIMMSTLFFKVRRMSDVGAAFTDSLFFDCSEVGTTVGLHLRVYNVPPGAGPVADTALLGSFGECISEALIVDPEKPNLVAPPSLTISCENFGPLVWPDGLVFSDNCGIQSIDTSFEYLPSELAFFEKKFGQARRVFTVKDCAGNVSTAVQSVTVNYREQFSLRFPDDIKTDICDSLIWLNANNQVEVLAQNCELLVFSNEYIGCIKVIPDACFANLRTYKVINLATYNPNLSEIIIPNPNNSTKGPTIWVGADGNNQFKWALADPAAPNNPTVWPRTIDFPGPLTGGQLGSPALMFTRVIKVSDDIPPVLSQVDYVFCDSSANDSLAWNQNASYNPWGIDNTWDPITQSHDLRDADLTLAIDAFDECGGEDVNFRFLLFLDLNGDGVMETTINTESPTWGFGIREDEAIGGKRIARLTRDVEWDDGPPFFNHQKRDTFSLPYGNHKIKWIAEDRCGNDRVKEFPIKVGPCQMPAVVCKNLLKINQLWQISAASEPSASRTATQFLKSAFDANTPFNQLQFSLRDPGINPGIGFPVTAAGLPVKSLTWDCDHLGFRPLELWVKNLAGDTDFCPTAVNVLDGTGLCMDSLASPSVEFRDENLIGPGRFEVFQNQPNPFFEQTEIPFNLPVDGVVTLRIFDAFGRILMEQKAGFGAGLNAFILNRNDLPGEDAARFYQILTAENSATRRF